MSAARSASERRLEDVAERFRREITAVPVPWRHRLRYWVAYVGLARRGVPVHSPDRDAQYADGFWKRGYDRSLRRIERHLLRRGTAAPADVLVPRFAAGELSIADVQLLMGLQIPFLIAGGAAHLPMARWTLDTLLEVAGECPVPINAALDRPSPDRSKPTKAHHYYDIHTGTVAEAVESIRSGGPMRISEAEDVMHHAGGRLRADLDLPHFEELAGWPVNQRHWLRSRLMVGKIVGAQLLVQPENAYSLWHAEPGDNFFVMASGSKTWTFAHPRYTAALRPRVKNTTNYHGSNIDIRESADVLRERGFGAYLTIPKAVVRVEAGDILRVPDHWWHTVETHPGSPVISVSIRSNAAPSLAGFGFGVLRALDERFHQLVRDLTRDGRLRDVHIGYPRPSRTARREPQSVAEPR